MAPTSLYILAEVKRTSGELAEGAGAFRPLNQGAGKFGLQARVFDKRRGPETGFPMRLLALGLLLCVSAGTVPAQSSIRQIDFRNFTYPLRGPLLGHSAMSWLGDLKNGYSNRPPIRLIGGADLSSEDGSGFTFDSVQYADLTGDEKQDAIVTLTYHTGGTQTTNYIYIYSLDKSDNPKLLDYCFTGDRAYSGLYKVHSENGELIFDLLDADQRSGDCCSSGFVETRYRWDGRRFVRIGPVTRGAVK
jgi:hypothetical protein